MTAELEPIVAEGAAEFTTPAVPTLNFDFSQSELASVPEIRSMIDQLEQIIGQCPQVEMPNTDYFSKGVYAREIRPKAGTLLVGKIHRHHTMNVISAGIVDVFSQDGGIVRFTAPYTFVSTPGAKRVIYVHEDAIWTCFHGTHETDVNKIEEEFIAKTYEDVVLPEALESSPQLQFNLEGSV